MYSGPVHHADHLPPDADQQEGHGPSVYQGQLFMLWTNAMDKCYGQMLWTNAMDRCYGQID